MSIVLGSYTFDESRTAVVEKHEEAGGQDARVIEIRGVIEGLSSVDAMEAELDAMLRQASEAGEETALTLRSGRRLLVSRTEFTREVARGGLVASFVLKLAARDPFEESTAESSVAWSITASGDTKALSTDGEVFALLKISLVASGTVVDPCFSDGTRGMTYSGEIADGETLVFDGPGGRVTLEGEDVTPYVDGLFPRVAPGGATLTYTDDASSSHGASVTVAHRARWW